jgi:hypothetical protein
LSRDQKLAKAFVEAEGEGMPGLTDLKRYRKWKDLVGAIDGRRYEGLSNPSMTVLEASYSTLSVKVRIGGEEVFVYDFSEGDVDQVHPGELARTFYKEYEQVRKAGLRSP